MDFTNAMPATPSMSSLQGDVFQQAMQQANHAHMQSPDFYSTSQPPLEPSTLNITPSPSDLSADTALPAYDLLYALVDLYFKYVNTWCPILRKSGSCFFFYSSLFQEPRGGLPKLSFSEMPSIFLNFSRGSDADPGTLKIEGPLWIACLGLKP
jgi:hypothetical protein